LCSTDIPLRLTLSSGIAPTQGVYVVRITDADFHVWSLSYSRKAVARAYVRSRAHLDQRKIEFLGDAAVDSIVAGGVQHKIKGPGIIDADLEPNHVLNKAERNLDGMFTRRLSDRD
jgi:hypothetical protein